MNVIVIGSGLAGLSAAIRASNLGANVSLISPNYSETSQSVMAMGGINAALNTKNENDSIQNHFKDTISGGCEINNFKAVSKLTSNAPKILSWLESIGVSFTRDNNGNIDLRYFGGQKHARTAYAGARTGKQLVTALTSLCRKKEVEGSVKRFVGWRFLSLILKNNQCFGVICIHEDTSEIKAFTGNVILASGGLNKLFGRTSGSILNDAYVTAKTLIQGVKLANLEMIQYHPTTVETSSKRILITEAARGEGGKLFTIKDGKEWYFMKEWYPVMAELMPRDVVSRSIYKASCAGKRKVYLDLRHLDEETIKVKLDEVYEICNNYLSLNPIIEPIPVYPGVHYFMGGILTDENHKTNVEGLYAAGECSCQYHGANRLGGNSLLGAIHGGLTAGENAVNRVDYDDELVELALKNEVYSFNNWDDSLKGVLVNELEEKLAYLVNDSMGIYRNEKDLQDAYKKLEKLKQSEINAIGNYYNYKKMRALIILAQAMILSAINRKESRGAHQREEYPKTMDNYKKTTLVEFSGEIKVSFEEI